MRTRTRTRSFARPPLLALAGLFLLGTAAAAQPPGGRGDRPGGHRGPGRLAEELGLSEQQQTQWREIHEQHRDQNRDLGRDLRDRRRELEQALDGGEEAKVVGKLAIEVHQLQQQLATRFEEMQLQLAAVLTDEQRAKWEELRERRGRHQRRDGHHRFGPPGEEG